MKDAPRIRGGLATRSVALFGGLLLFGFAIVLMLESRLGLPPWDVLHYGISLHTPLSLGAAGIVVGLVLVVFTWIEGTAPGFGTIANAIVIGLSIDVLRSFDAVDALSGSSLVTRIALLVTGIVLFGVGSAFYLGAGMGAGPRDSLMMVLSRRTGKRIGLVRGAMEITVLLSGLALGGIAGIGTLALALLIGPVVELAFWSLVRLGLAAPGGRDTVEFGPLDGA
jgi:uncharacterized membrane protein YczE